MQTFKIAVVFARFQCYHHRTPGQEITPINPNLTDYLTASLYAFGGIPTVRLKKRQNWEEVAKPR